jgi:DNA-binding transcriptional MocR family regulator
MHTSIQGTLPLGQQDRYTRLPDAILGVLKPREHQVTHLLLSYRWFADSTIRPFVATMATRLGCSRRTVQRALRGLEAKGYLVTVARYRDDSDGGQTSNIYAPGPLLLPLLPVTDDAPARQSARPPMTGRAQQERHSGNNTSQNRMGYGSKSYYETRDGDLRMREPKR